MKEDTEQNKNQLPKGWKWDTIPGVVGKNGIFVDGDWIESKDQDPNGDVRLIQLADIGDGNFRNKSSRYLTTKRAKEINCTFLSEGDILVARMPDPIGRACVFPLKEANKYVTAVDVAIIRPDKEIVDTKFLLYSINNPKYRNSIENLQSGTTRKRISRKNLSILDFPLPPKSTQQAIVSKIEELFSELDKGIENLHITQQQLKTYRQSVLKWAFEGKLSESGFARLKNDQDLVNKEILQSLNSENPDSDKCELPKGWKMVKLGDISECILGKMLDKQKNIGTPKPYLRNINVRWNGFKLDDIFEMRFQENEDKRFGILKGDLIICEGGEPGRAAIWKGQIPNMKIQKALHRVRFNNSACAEYFLYYLNLISSTKHLDQYFTGTTIKHLTGQSLKKISIPLPSIKEQQNIVQTIESRLSVADKMEESITQSLQQAEALRQSILKKAFEGRLI